MANLSGWPWKYVWEDCDMDVINAMEAEWELRPPVQLLVAGFLGYKAPETKNSNLTDLLSLPGVVMR